MLILLIQIIGTGLQPMEEETRIYLSSGLSTEIEMMYCFKCIYVADLTSDTFRIWETDLSLMQIETNENQ